MVNLLGKVLRIDVRTHPYTIPPDNPYVNRAGWRPEIWAHGLRNPWRFSFDDATGRLFIGDVGQDAREEINAAPYREAGLNYGWRYMEGSACYLPSSNCASGLVLQPPVYEYTHADGCSVTGGYVYRGSAIPELNGHYLFADYCRGWVRSFRPVGNGVVELTTWAGITAPQAVSFGQDGSRELYLIAGTSAWKMVRQ
jgi:glucose/arabinose dehydrogenase